MRKANKILVITGQTATGKTSLSVKIAKKVPSTLISSDSRQVYKEMEIVTGQDHPEGVEIKGIGIINPDQEFSVSNWSSLAKRWIKESWEEGKLPILVGGTWLYIKSLIDGIETAGIPPDKELRENLEKKSLEFLQNNLKRLNKEKYLKLNNSDVNNKLRLIRAIEIEKSGGKKSNTKLDADYKIYVFKSPENLRQKIKERVIKRIEEGAVDETRRLIKKYEPSLQSMSGIGYEPLIKYVRDEISEEELVNEWTSLEYSYSKRQMTWFKSLEEASWIEPEGAGQVVKEVKTWYHYS